MSENLLSPLCFACCTRTSGRAVHLGLQTSKHLQREAEDDEDEEMGLGGPGAVEVEDASQPGHERHATAASKKHHKEDAAAAAKLMREWSDVHLKVSSPLRDLEVPPKY